MALPQISADLQIVREICAFDLRNLRETFETETLPIGNALAFFNPLSYFCASQNELKKR
jgi:hypothetical protein